MKNHYASEYYCNNHQDTDTNLKMVLKGRNLIVRKIEVNHVLKNSFLRKGQLLKILIL